MRLLYWDCETFYSTEYSLTRMDPPSYILDPRFEMIMAGYAFDESPVRNLAPHEIPYFLKTLDAGEIAMVSHNAQFDASILSWRYDWRPRLIIDTLSISRTVLANKLRNHTLAAVAEHLGFPPKLVNIVREVKGMTRADIIANGMMEEYELYNSHDVDLCRQIFNKLAPDLPDEEFLVHDLVLRMAVDPVLHADVTVLAQYGEEVRARKEQTLARAMLLGIESEKDLMSNDKLAKVLMAFGITPPRKLSPATGVMTWAFAKTDEAFQALREHENPYVRDIVEARLKYKSTIEETRTARLLNIGSLGFPHHGEHVLPIALRIAGARTHRLSGDWKCNFQNLGRESTIRNAVMAPPGHMLVKADAAQIEARFLAWYCGQEDLLEQFRQGLDVYALFASRLFGYTVTKETHKRERFLGKTGVLGCGYQCGPDKFAAMVKSLSVLTFGGVIELTVEEAVSFVALYRQINDRISWKWNWLNTVALPFMANHRNRDTGATMPDGPVTFGHNEVTGPSNLKMFYPSLEKRSGGEWTYIDVGEFNKIYGGKLIENIIQHLARVFIMQVALRMVPHTEELRARLVLQSHDELVYCVPTEQVEILKGLLRHEMTTPSSWCSAIPLATEVKVGPNYGNME